MFAIACVLLALVVCAYKGAKLPIMALNHEREKRMFKHWFGFGDPLIAYVYVDIRAAPWREKMHSITNLATEWCRLDPQRAVKALSALIVIPWLIHWITHWIL